MCNQTHFLRWIHLVSFDAEWPWVRTKQHEIYLSLFDATHERMQAAHLHFNYFTKWKATRWPKRSWIDTQKNIKSTCKPLVFSLLVLFHIADATVDKFSRDRLWIVAAIGEANWEKGKLEFHAEIRWITLFLLSRDTNEISSLKQISLADTRTASKDADLRKCLQKFSLLNFVVIREPRTKNQMQS